MKLLSLCSVVTTHDNHVNTDSLRDGNIECCSAKVIADVIVEKNKKILMNLPMCLISQLKTDLNAKTIK